MVHMNRSANRHSEIKKTLLKTPPNTKLDPHDVKEIVKTVKPNILSCLHRPPAAHVASGILLMVLG